VRLRRSPARVIQRAQRHVERRELVGRRREVSAHFTPPWSGKFASDYFHPSQEGYRDWARALLAAVPAPAR
jgi:lysophospholipase L1-like esterase